MSLESQILDRAFAALSDPTRREIVMRLAEGEATVTELAKPFAISLPAVSKHIRVLERAGLIEQRRQAQRRPCRIVPNRLREVTEWLEQYSALWDARLDRLTAHLDEIQKRPKD
ncbi:MAG: ArsR/SmtB family transcription factor [Solirubrobacterales bacterium]